MGKETELFKKITITGDLGSGKSKIGRMLQERIAGAKYYSTGALQRKMATDEGMTTLEFNRYAEIHADIDARIDALSQEISSKPMSFVLDARMGWYFIPDAFNVYLAVQESVAALRVYNDTSRRNERYQSLAEAHKLLQLRQKSEWERFNQLYHSDLLSASHYHMIIDTSYATPEEVLTCLLERINQYYTAVATTSTPTISTSTTATRSTSTTAIGEHVSKKVEQESFIKKATCYAVPHFLYEEVAGNQGSVQNLFQQQKQTSAASILATVLQESKNVHCFYEQFPAIYQKYTNRPHDNTKLTTIAAVISP
ncbi:hypothetical protein COTS27_00690 [Spirochaetota bacterium]|nr:hypothetical protein COTS27_00690 [Spirochaetota bacterium]